MDEEERKQIREEAKWKADIETRLTSLETTAIKRERTLQSILVAVSTALVVKVFPAIASFLGGAAK